MKLFLVVSVPISLAHTKILVRLERSLVDKSPYLYPSLTNHKSFFRLQVAKSVTLKSGPFLILERLYFMDIWECEEI